MVGKVDQTSPESQGIFLGPAKKPTPRVLVVDDERLVRWSVTEALRAHGLEAEDAGDGKSAIARLDEGCDLVLLDLCLPDSQDFRVLSTIRSQAPSVPVILMTSYASREIAEAAAALGASLMPKPFDLDDLMVAVDAALAGAAS
jgi:DNA-binding NtrC family response regulator